MFVMYIIFMVKCIYHARILAPDTGQCPAKNRVKSAETFFTIDTVVQREVKQFYLQATDV